MKGKTYVTVKLPATRASYGFWLPRGMAVRQATALVAELLEAREGGRYARTRDAGLMDSSTGDLLDPASTVAAAGVVDGARLVLV